MIRLAHQRVLQFWKTWRERSLAAIEGVLETRPRLPRANFPAGRQVQVLTVSRLERHSSRRTLMPDMPSGQQRETDREDKEGIRAGTLVPSEAELFLALT